jgi:hypothetical protein
MIHGEVDSHASSRERAFYLVIKIHKNWRDPWAPSHLNDVKMVTAFPV